MNGPDLRALQTGEAEAWDEAFRWLWPTVFAVAQLKLQPYFPNEIEDVAIEALEEMERRQFDVLLSDIGMPEMDGYALIRHVRQLPAERGGAIAAAALTAYAGIEDRKRVLSAGYQMHIPKPVAPDELATVVADLAERYASTAAI